jgi:hypothetical protein
MTKSLEKNSAYNQFDSDGDGTITDEELSRSERMMMIDNMDKMADQQRIMAWFALGLPFILMGYFASPFVPLDKVSAVMGLATTFSAGMSTIVVAFMAAQAYARGKMHE